MQDCAAENPLQAAGSRLALKHAKRKFSLQAAALDSGARLELGRSGPQPAGSANICIQNKKYRNNF